MVQNHCGGCSLPLSLLAELPKTPHRRKSCRGLALNSTGLRYPRRRIRPVSTERRKVGGNLWREDTDSSCEAGGGKFAGSFGASTGVGSSLFLIAHSESASRGGGCGGGFRVCLKSRWADLRQLGWFAGVSEKLVCVRLFMDTDREACRKFRREAGRI